MNQEKNWSKRGSIGYEEPLIFEKSVPGQEGFQVSSEEPKTDPAKVIPKNLLRKDKPALPEVGEPEVVRHYSRLSTWNYSVDHGFYPLGSCTMKYNPKINEFTAALPGFAGLHPEAPESLAQGMLELWFRLERDLAEICGMDAVTIQPCAGAHGELTGMLLFRAYFDDKGQKRTKILLPDTAHGTNPASATLAGFEVAEVETQNGMLTPELIKPHLDGSVAGLMLTNPNTLGLFETHIAKIADMIHEAGGLLYMDGANLNALMGIARPGDMGVDVMQMNLHKTFSTPHGGGGPGSGPVAIKKFLEPYLPNPRVVKDGNNYKLDCNRPKSIGRMTGWYGNSLVWVKAFTYLLRMGKDGLKLASEIAVLNANYIRVKLREHYQITYPDTCMHECVFSDKGMPNEITTMDIAKRLIDYGFHPPTIYFPLVIHGSIMVEPTETESKARIDEFIAAMVKIKEEAQNQADLLKSAPLKTPVARLDEVAAARHPVLCWAEEESSE